MLLTTCVYAEGGDRREGGSERANQIEPLGGDNQSDRVVAVVIQACGLPQKLRVPADTRGCFFLFCGGTPRARTCSIFAGVCWDRKVVRQRQGGVWRTRDARAEKKNALWSCGQAH